MAKGLTKRGYAKHRGVSEAAVRKAVKTGRISERRDGKIDPELADKQWERNTDPTKPLNSVTGDPKHRKPSPDAPSEPLALDGTRGRGKSKDPLLGFARARTQREIVKALREQLAYRREIEGWVPLERVRAAAAAAGEIACNRIMTQDARLAKVLAGLPVARCRKILRDDNRKTCEELRQALERAARGER